MRPVRLWIGLVLLVLGVLGILDAAGALDSDRTIDRWWPMAITGLGLVTMLAQRRVSLGPALVTLFGLVLLGEAQNWVSGDLVGPALLILIGGAVLVSLWRHRTHVHPARSEPTAMFGGARTVDRSEHLTHADVSAVFGGATLDLREAHIDKEATVDALALFGGVDVLVPKGWRVSLGGLPVFGGYEDKTTTDGPLPVDAPVLTVNATAIFGAVEVANEPT